MQDVIFDDDDDDDITRAIATIVAHDDTDTSDDNDDADADDDDDDNTPMHGWGTGSRPGKSGNLERHRVFYSHLLYNDFWGPAPVYNAMYFKRFFKVPIGLFDTIVEDVTEHDKYFVQKADAAGKMGFTPIQKICSAVRLLMSGQMSMMTSIAWRPQLAWTA